MQWLRSVVTEQMTIWESITVVLALDFLYDDFKMTIASLLHFQNKNFKKIKQIITSIKAENLTKQIMGAIADLTRMTKKKQSERNDLRVNEECFNCRKSTSNS